MRIVADLPDRQHTIFDAANIDQQLLVDGFEAALGDEISEDDLADIYLAEIVRRYVREDRSPPGAQDQNRSFDVVQIASELPIPVSRDQIDEAIVALSERDLVTFSIDEVGLVAKAGEVFLSQAGVQRGLALIDRFVPKPRYPRGTIVADSRRWTGLMRTKIDERSRERITSAIEKALLLIDERVTENERHAQAVSHLHAALSLVHAPEPPSKLIWQLIHNAAAIAGLFGLFLQIFMPAE